MARDNRFDDRGGDAWDEELELADSQDEEDDDWTEEDEARYQARRREELKRSRRTRRQAISFLVLVLLVLGAGLGATGIVQGWWEWPFGDDPLPTEGTPCGAPTPVAALPADTTVVVLNATQTRGLAAKVAELLTTRGFSVDGVGNEEEGIRVVETAQIRYGPEAALQAKAVAAHFPSPVLVDDGRTGTIVEIAVGEGFTKNTTPEAAAAAVAPIPGPSTPGCVPASTPATVTPTATTTP